MYRKEILIVVTNYAELKAWGVNGKPVLNNGNYLMPLGWEEELIKEGIEFEVREVEIFEEIIE